MDVVFPDSCSTGTLTIFEDMVDINSFNVEAEDIVSPSNILLGCEIGDKDGGAEWGLP